MWKRWRFRIVSIQNRIFFSSALLLVCALLVTGLLFNTVSSSVSAREARASNQRELALITNNLASQLTHICDYAVSIAVNPEVIEAMRGNPSLPEDRAVQYSLKKALNKTVSSVMGLNRNVYMWDLVSAGGEFFHAGGYYSMAQVEALMDRSVFARPGQELGVSITGPFTINDRYNKSTPVFLVTKPVVSLDSRELYGFVVFVIRESTFAAVFEDNMPPGSVSSFYILDETGAVVSSSEKGAITRQFSQLGLLTDEELARLRSAGTLLKNVDGAEMLLGIQRDVSKRTGWTVINCQPLDALLTGQRALNRSLIITGGLACLVALAVSFLVSRSISRPILRLAHTIHDAARGDMNQTADWNGGGEIQVLYSGFNSLMNTVNSLLRRVYREQEEKSEYQFHLIQEQIKPHFLYNTLEMIRSLNELGMGDTANQCVTALASFYRLSLSRGDDIIPIRDELKLSEQYMYLQKLRYIEYLDYRFDVPETLGEYRLPKMTIQPLLENAIYHGVKEREDPGLITVTVREEGMRLTVTVEDNGRGMDGAALERLRASLSQPEAARSFGVTSVNRRLRLLYKDQCGLSIDSAPGEGTRVTITIEG